MVDSIFPRTSTFNGVSSATIFGKNFVDSDKLHCKFGAAYPVRAMFDSSEQIRCPSPAGVRGIIGVTVSNSFIGQAYNDKDFTATSAEFSFTGARPRITSLSPLYGPTLGGTAVTLVGEEFRSFDEGLWCRFGGTVTVRAVQTTTRNITCSTPSGLEGNTTVEVTNNHYTYSAYDNFEYQSLINVTTVTPSRTTTKGGSMVSVVASGLSSRSASPLNVDMSTDIWCRFGRNPTEAIMETQAMNIFYYAQFERSTTPRSVSCLAGAHKEGWVALKRDNKAFLLNGHITLFRGIPCWTVARHHRAMSIV